MADKTEVPTSAEQKDYVTVRMNHVNSANVDLIFSDAIAIQHTDSEFTITFSQIQQPLIFEESDYEGLDTVEAKVMARIVLTPKRMGEFIQSLSTNWKIFEARMKKIRAELEAAKAKAEEEARGK